MTDRPIIFSAPMVRALLAGTKTQTRRILNAKPGMKVADCTVDAGAGRLELPVEKLRVPYAVGDRLWVRESYFQFGHWEPVPGAVTRKGRRQKWRFVSDDGAVLFDPPAEFRKGRHSADPATPTWHQRLARFMPRKLSRLTLTVTDVRVQRLQEISDEDCLAEGVFYSQEQEGYVTDEETAANYHSQWPSVSFCGLWSQIHGSDAWSANPWIVALSFTVDRRNIDV